MTQRTIAVLAVALVAGATLAGCGGGTGIVTLNGAGATFPYPLYSKWIAEYNRLNPTVQINYQSIGSGGGIRQITERTVDFGASDAPMTEDELAAVRGTLLHIPTTLGAVVVVYNLPDAPPGLHLTGETIAGVYLGEITRWNDRRIAALNPEVALPDRAIVVVGRSDGSGTTAVFTSYLASVSPAWAERVGAGKSVRWPAGLAAKGNEGVTGQVTTTEGAIGYVELAYAEQNELPFAAVRNREGNFVLPSPASVSAAAAGAVADMPEDLRMSIVDAAGEDAYPISAFTYLLVYEDLGEPRRGEALARFLWWAVHEGQAFAPELHYAPLPAPVVERVERKLGRLHAGGERLLAGR